MEKDIIENNKLIGEFMGYEKGVPHQTDKHGYHQCEDGFEIPLIINHYKHDEDIDCHQFLLEQLQFHTSWDWLVPVVEKIESLGYIFMICKHEAGVTCDRSSGLERPKCDVKADSKLKAVYDCAVNFIKWYTNK